MTHHGREGLKRPVPYHLSWHVTGDIKSLRGKKLFRQIRKALYRCHEKPGFRIVHFSVQSNHLHALGEADDVRSLSRGMQGLGVSMAKRINKVSGRRGAVFDDRFFARPLRTPREVAVARNYVLRNSEMHERRLGIGIPRDDFDPFSSAACEKQWPGMTSPPQTWLLAVGSRKAHPPGRFG
jgi:REP element-mobilizing transposase RayT